MGGRVYIYILIYYYYYRCIFGELLIREPLFRGEGEIDQLFKIFKVLGTPKNEELSQINKSPYFQNIKVPQYPNQLKQKLQQHGGHVFIIIYLK